MRCKCCNALLSDYDLRRKTKQGTPEEFCNNCRFASDFPDLLDWKWKQMEDLCSESNIHVSHRDSGEDY